MNRRRILAGAAALVAAGEAAHWLASYAALPRPIVRPGQRPQPPGTRQLSPGPRQLPPRSSPELGAEPEGPWLILVLGYHNRHPSRINLINRRRVAAAARTLAAAPPGSRVRFSGGARDGGTSEAALMAAYGRVSHHLPVERIDLDEDALSTWENVANAIPAIAAAERVAIVSDSLHAARARIYLAHQRPDLAVRLIRGRDYRAGELWWLKPGLAAYGLVDLATGWLSLRRRHGGGPPRLDARVARQRARHTRD